MSHATDRRHVVANYRAVFVNTNAARIRNPVSADSGRAARKPFLIELTRELVSNRRP